LGQVGRSRSSWQQRNGIIGRGGPIGENPIGCGVEEDEPGQVRRHLRTREHRCVQLAPERIGRGDVQVAVDDHRRGGDHAVRDVIGSVRYAKSRPDTASMTTFLLSVCLGADSTCVAMAKHPEEFGHIKSLILLQPVSANYIIEES
jgi:hypothetical protein